MGNSGRLLLRNQSDAVAQNRCYGHYLKNSDAVSCSFHFVHSCLRLNRRVVRIPSAHQPNIVLTLFMQAVSGWPVNGSTQRGPQTHTAMP